jgi:hypothetical protein
MDSELMLQPIISALPSARILNLFTPYLLENRKVVRRRPPPMHGTLVFLKLHHAEMALLAPASPLHVPLDCRIGFSVKGGF